MVQSNPASVSVMSPADIENVICGCSDRKQPLVTATSDALATRSWRNVPGALALDLSRMSWVRIDPARRIALVGPGARYSSLIMEAAKGGMTPDIETPACLDFTFADWAHESLRMLSTSNSGVDGILRNIKVTTPITSYQTGYDSFPANGGGYDLTKLFLTTGMSLGIPTEFAIPLRPIADVALLRTCAFDKIESATAAGALISRSGYARSVMLKSAGFDELLSTGKAGQSSAAGNLMIRVDGSKAIVDAGIKFIDETIAKGGGKKVDERQDAPVFVDPMSVNPNAWLLGVCVADTKGLPDVLKGITEIAKKSSRALQYSVSDISPTTSVLVPAVQGPASKELLGAIGNYLADCRISLRGNPEWNPLLGDARAVTRIEIVKGIKKLVDPNMILNPHMLGVF